MYIKSVNATSQQRYHHNHSHEDEVFNSEPHAVGSHTHTHQNTKAVLNRISKVSGHLVAVGHMVEDGRDCSEVLIQLAAIRSAINGICKVILKDHIDHCIVDAIKTGDIETIAELNKSIEMLMK